MTKSGFRYAAAGVRRATTLLAIASLPSLAACARSHLARGDIDSAPVTPNRLTRAERDAGWTLLFDGRTLAGWQRHVVLTAVAYAWLQHQRRHQRDKLPTLPVARAVITEILTAHFFVTHPHYLDTMLKLKEINLRI